MTILFHLKLGLSLLTIAVFKSAALACTPCSEKLDFEESFKQANLVIIGARVDYKKPEAELKKPGDPTPRRPASIRVKVKKVIKGVEPNKEISIKSWSGSCPYGFILDDKNYLILLSKKSEGYDPINHGCAFKATTVEDDHIIIDNKRLAIDDLGLKKPI